MGAPASLTRPAPKPAAADTTATRVDTAADRANARRREARRQAGESRLRQQLEALLAAKTQASAKVAEAQAAGREAARNWGPETARPEDRDETDWDTTIDCFVAEREHERLLEASYEQSEALTTFCRANLDRDWRERTVCSVLADHGLRIDRRGGSFGPRVRRVAPRG